MRRGLEASEKVGMRVDEKREKGEIDSDEADDITEAKRGEEKAGCTWQERRVDMTWT